MSTFSERERKIIKIIGTKRMTFSAIGAELFKTEDEPFDSDITIGNSVRRIIRKCDYFELDWSLEKVKKNNRLLIKRIKVS